jgi:thiol-disulfide isomerase/thioredoxin
MNCIKITLIILGFACLISWTQGETIELPLTKKIGYGPFISSTGGMSLYSNDENNPWVKTYLKIKGAPADWTETKFGDIDLNIFQTVYQNYLVGNITEERFNILQKSWSWIPDSLNLSKAPLQCKVAFAFGKDSSGEVKMIIDTNNNLDLSDDKPFKPIVIDYTDITKIDSIQLSNSITIFYEDFVNKKIVKESTPVFITYNSEIDMVMCNFPQYKTTKFKGVEIAVCSANFCDLMYDNPMIAIVSDKLKKGEKIDRENIFSKNENIEINGEIYKNKGMNKYNNTLLIERLDLPKDQQYSTQIGYKPFPFKGVDFKTNAPIVLADLKGKYVYLDFWAYFCKPCLEEIPNITELYSKIDTSKIKFIGIVCETPSSALNKLVTEHSIDWPQILSSDTNNIKDKYNIRGYPTTLLIDTEGVIIARDLRGKELEDKVISLTKK